MTWDDLRAEAFGEVGLLPKDFYEMERGDYWLLHRGFFNKREYELQWVRNALVILISPWVKSPPSPFQIMPLPSDDKLRERMAAFDKNRRIRVSEKSLEILKKFKEREQGQKSKDN
jgi:hypothetical protein